MIINKKINKYIALEFFAELVKVFFIFFVLILLTITFDEINLLKNLEDNKIFSSLKLIFYKLPSILFNFSPFIFLFSGILFNLKLKNRNEIVSIRIIGISNFKLLSISSITALALGYIIILMLNPLSSAITKEYENLKSIYFKNKNSIYINDTGLWILIDNVSNKKVIRIENLNFDRNLAKNITIFNLNNDFELQSRIDSKEGVFSNKTIKLLNSSTYVNKKSSLSIAELQVDLNLSLIEIQTSFKNSSTVSIYEIQNQIKNIQNLGYSAEKLKIEYQKLMSLPIYLLAMVLLSGLLIVNLGTNMGYLFYVILGVIISVILYFLSDLSITLGKTEKINLELSVWLPVFFIMIINFIGLIQVNAK